MNIRKKVSITLMVALVVLFVGFPVLAQEEGIEFFKGKTINFITPHSVGGGYDAYSRAFTSYLGKYIPGTTIVVRNISGAGGIIGRNKIYEAPADGLTIGLETGSGSIFTQLVGASGVKYDITKMTILGRVSIDLGTLAVKSDLPFYSVSDLQKTEKPLKIAVGGVGSDDYYTARLIGEELGIDVKIIPGYKGAREVGLAAVRGETDAAHTEVTTIMPLIKSGDLRPLWLIALERSSYAPGVPTSVELAKKADKEGASLIIATTKIWGTGRMIIGPPGIPEERVKILREASYKAMNDPGFLDWGKRAERPIDPLTGEELEKLIKESMALGNKLTPIFKSYLK